MWRIGSKMLIYKTCWQVHGQGQRQRQVQVQVHPALSDVAVKVKRLRLIAQKMTWKSQQKKRKRETLNKVIVIIFGLHTLRVNLQISYKLPHRFKYFMHQYTLIAYMSKNVTSYNKYYFYSDSGCAGRGLRWKATPLTPNLAEYQHQDETDLDRHGWTPLDYFEQYIEIWWWRLQNALILCRCLRVGSHLTWQ